MEWYESLEKQISTLFDLYKNRNEFEDQFENFIAFIKSLSGVIYFTGVGKSGFVAKKVASTYNSLGIRSFFIDPVDTLHGDMGIFSKEDAAIFISKSGETKELFKLFDELKNRGIKIIAVTANRNSYISENADLQLIIPIKSEGDFLNDIVPLASTITFEAVLQSLAVEIASSRGFTLKDFLYRHPGGKIGETEVH
ncbi:MAG: SIS domain-containing protein [Minisyncoccia bacterium]